MTPATLHRKAARCSKCGSKLRVEIDTDGYGGIVDLVDPCPTCAPQSRIRVRTEVADRESRMLRQRAHRAARKAGSTTITKPCRRCGRPFTQPRRTGRPFELCAACKPRIA